MKLNSSGNRTIDWDQFQYPDILGARNCPLILIKSTGEILCASTKSAKRELVEKFNDQRDVLLSAWPGQWSTDVFRLSEADLIRDGCLQAK